MRSLIRRVAKATLAAGAVLVLTGCAVFAEFLSGFAPLSGPEGRATISLPELSGPYPVGRRFMEWTDDARSDPFHTSARRELIVSIWYPAAAGAANQTGTYLPGDAGLWPARFQSMMLRMRFQGFRSALLRNPLPAERIRNIRTHAAENAPVSQEAKRFPLLLFSPGYGAMPTEYTAVLEDIASHGYIVAGIQPTGFVPVTVLAGGRTIYPTPWKASLYDLGRAYPVWIQDMVFVLNQLTRENEDQQSPLYERMDLTRIGAFGHSFGGATAAGACHSDPRIQAGLNLDGPSLGERSGWKFPQPFMLVESSRRAYRDGVAEDFLRALNTGYRTVIRGSTHHGFTDETVLPMPADRRTSLVGDIPGPRMVRMTCLLVCTFFDIHLRRSAGVTLQDVSSQFPEVIVEPIGSLKSAARAK